MSSYIAFDLDALNVAADVGHAAGISEELVITGLARLWAFCFRQKTDRVSFLHLKGFFKGGDAWQALVAFGFLAVEPGTTPPGQFDPLDDAAFRVRGADRYLRISEGRRKGGKAAAAAGNLLKGAARSAPALAPAAPQLEPGLSPALGPAQHQPYTEHRAPSTEHRAPVAAEAPPPQLAVVESVDPTPPGELHQHLTPPDSPPDGWTAEDFWRWAQCLRRDRAGLVIERWPKPRALSDWWREASAVASVETLRDAFVRYGDDKHWQTRTPPLPWAGWASQWGKYLLAGGARAAR